MDNTATSSSPPPRAAEPLSTKDHPPQQHNRQDGVREQVDTTGSRHESPSESSTPSTHHEKVGSGSKEAQNEKCASHDPKPKKSFLAPWVTDNIKNTHSLKMLFRCWLVSWVAIIVILPNKTLQTLGQASFFVCMVTVFLPANIPVFVWLFANATLVIGAIIGWAWGCAAMAAALRARDNTLLESQIQKVVAGNGNTGTNPEATIQAAVFQAQFLDSRSSAVFGVFLTIGSYAAAVLFVKSPKLRFMAIFMTIVMDILCTYGPLFPTAQYTLGEIFLLPIGVSLGISFAGMLFIFPETLSHVWQGKLAGLFKATKGFLALTDEFLHALKSTSGSSSSATVKEYSAKFRASMAGQVALFEMLDGQKGFLHMEATYSALSSQDLVSFVNPIRAFSLRTFGLLAFNNALETRADQEAAEDGHEDETPKDREDEKESLKNPVRLHDTEILTRLGKKMRAAEEEQGVNLERDLIPMMIESSRDVFAKATGAIDEIVSWLEYTNNHRYLGQHTAEQHGEVVRKLQHAAEALEIALTEFETTERLKLVAPYEAHFEFSEEARKHVLDADGARAFRLGAQSLFFCLTWCANCLEAGRELAKVARLAHKVASKRPESKIWLPKGLRNLGHLLFSHKGDDAMNSLPMDPAHKENADGSDDSDGTDHPDVFDDEATAADDHDDDHSRDADQKEREKRDRSEAEEAHKKEKLRLHRLAQRDADALPPSSALHHVGRFLASAYHFFWSPVGLFALRYTIAGLVLWIPSVATQSSAAFSYHNRGIWAIIMAQLSVSLTHGEQVFSLASRIFGTVAGALIGAAMWYISTGDGNGNPYGFGAVTAVGFLPFVFLRIFAPMQYLIANLMTFVTLILVVGYSWQDTGRLTVSVNSGIGINMAWRRMLLVMVGIGVGVVVMLFPKPPSTRSAVRLNFAKSSNKKILKLYSSIIEAWAVQLTVYEDDKMQQVTKSHQPSLSNFRRDIFVSYELLKNLQTQIAMANLEIQARGKWPAARYEQLLKTHSRMLGALGQLYAVLNDRDYDVEWRKRFAHMTALLDPSTISDICLTLSLLGQSLKTGTRLPHASIFVRERALKSFHRTIAIEEKLRKSNNPNAIQHPLDLQLLKSRQFMTHVQGTVALTVFLGNLDEAMMIVRDLVGEEPLMGYENLQKRWEQRAFLLDP
ncbi:unnamed protein product [Sympodiomycopsis kandeliae]